MRYTRSFFLLIAIAVGLWTAQPVEARRQSGPTKSGNRRAAAKSVGSSKTKSSTVRTKSRRARAGKASGSRKSRRASRGVKSQAASSAASEAAASTRFTARSAILIDEHTGVVVWERNPDEPLPPASTTKVMTALVALKSGRFDDPLVVSEQAAQAPPSKIALRPGWQMRLEDLLYAILLNSANDASIVIAEGLAGSVQKFAERMNAEARAIGAQHSHFVNPNGLPADDHYSTARDLATIFAHAKRDPRFEAIISTRVMPVVPVAGSSRVITLHTHNRLLGDYEIHVVGKTGWTRAAKKCFVGEASIADRELIVAVLGSTNLWGDLKRLIEFGMYGTSPPDEPPLQTEAREDDRAPAAVGDEDGDEPRAAGNQRFTVQLAAVRSLSNARQLRESVSRKGYPARVEARRSGQRTLYRVMVGRYPTRAAADSTARRLRNSTPHVSPIIVAVD
jgi:D-alanyl-D-alanine carboxypeptidase (penicillin-binding protein 5/6)